jgi:hypothetical protein
MTRQFCYFIILTLLISCELGGQESKREALHTADKTKAINEIRDIRFAVKAGRINTFKETVEIKATLYNDNIDTAYFLTSTCGGEQYSLRYDTAKFELISFMNCNASFPRLAKIAPKGEYDFQAHFRCISSETKIKIGFDFYSVDKSFDLTNKSLGTLNIFNRPLDEQTIIWAQDVAIK